jgi:DNA-binding NarL/FixJ family response regulator
MLTWASSAAEALEALSRKTFDLVITLPRVDETDALELGQMIKDKFAELPVFVVAHTTDRRVLELNYSDSKAIDRVYVWRGNTDLFLALIKNREDRMNVAHDTQRAQVRVIIMVEDSPIYLSTLLPLLYKEIVTQTQAVMEESVNDEHRILRMRARPRILVAQSYEEAMDLYQRYRPYLLSIFSDVSFPKNGSIEDDAGFMLLSRIRGENPDLPLLSMSTEDRNRDRVTSIPAVFLHKNSPTLHSDIRQFFMRYLGFGDFIFRLPDGTRIASASNLRKMQEILASIPDESVYYHARSNHFSSWLMARSEIRLASKLKPVKVSDFSSAADIKKYLIGLIHERRVGRQKGNITAFDPDHFDPEADFVKIGKGSLGGKARGLAFMSTQLKNNSEFIQTFKDVEINVPKTVVISTEAFDAFLAENGLTNLSTGEYSDTRIRDLCLAARLPDWLRQYLQIYIETTRYPLAIRSSSLLEDAQFQPFAGIYKTYMIPNRDPDDTRRLEQLIMAVKLVYASTFSKASRAFAESTAQSMEDEKMAVVIQQLTGGLLDDYFYPAISGVAQSYNYYPIAHLKAEEGIAQIALGLGKTVVEGGTALRFSPKYPQLMPQFSTVNDILANAQRFFYVLKMDGFPQDLPDNEDATLDRLEIHKVLHHPPVRQLCSTGTAPRPGGTPS